MYVKILTNQYELLYDALRVDHNYKTTPNHLDIQERNGNFTNYDAPDTGAFVYIMNDKGDTIQKYRLGPEAK